MVRDTDRLLRAEKIHSSPLLIAHTYFSLFQPAPSNQIWNSPPLFFFQARKINDAKHSRILNKLALEWLPYIENRKDFKESDFSTW